MIQVVVVSQWTGVLDLVASALAAREVPHLRLDGGVPVSKRHIVVNAFRGECVPVYSHVFLCVCERVIFMLKRAIY
jgi:SNF2 family DNA or RNA helicase